MTTLLSLLFLCVLPVIVSATNAQIVVMTRGSVLATCETAFPFQTGGFFGLTSGECYDDVAAQGWTPYGFFSATDQGSSALIAYDCDAGCGSTCANTSVVTYGTCIEFLNGQVIQVWKVASGQVSLTMYDNGCGSQSQTSSQASGSCSASGNFVAATSTSGTYVYALSCTNNCNACITYGTTPAASCISNAGVFAEINAGGGRSSSSGAALLAPLTFSLLSSLAAAVAIATLF